MPITNDHSDILAEIGFHWTSCPSRHEAPGAIEQTTDMNSEDEAAQDATADTRVRSGRMVMNEDRKRLGLPLYDFPEADMPMVITQRGVIFLEGASQDDFDYIPALSSGKRCGIQWAPWMGDWFTSWSPRNSNTNAEGPWDHWIDLAISILKDPLTSIVRPEAYGAVKDLQTYDLYDETRHDLTDENLTKRFTTTDTPDA